MAHFLQTEGQHEKAMIGKNGKSKIEEEIEWKSRIEKERKE